MRQSGGFGRLGLVCAALCALAGCGAGAGGAGELADTALTLVQETAEIGAGGVTSSGTDALPATATFNSATNTVTFDIDGLPSIEAGISATGGVTTFTGSFAGGTLEARTGQLDHAVFGTWVVDRAAGSTSLSRFHAGDETPVAEARVLTGSATYDGDFTGVLTRTDAGVTELVDVVGDAQLTVTFGTGGSVAGSVTSAQALTGALFPINDISLSGTLTDATFQGTATFGADPGNDYSFTAGTAGQMDGALYGPGAGEAAGV